MRTTLPISYIFRAKANRIKIVAKTCYLLVIYCDLLILHKIVLTNSRISHNNFRLFVLLLFAPILLKLSSGLWLVHGRKSLQRYINDYRCSCILSYKIVNIHYLASNFLPEKPDSLDRNVPMFIDTNKWCQKIDNMIDLRRLAVKTSN